MIESYYIVKRFFL